MRPLRLPSTLLAAFAAVACLSQGGHPMGQPSREDGDAESRSPDRAGVADQAEAGSERLRLVSQTGWRPLAFIPPPPREPRFPRTPSYAAPPSAADFRLVGPVEVIEALDGRRGRAVKKGDATKNTLGDVDDDAPDAARTSASASPVESVSTLRSTRHQGPQGPSPLPPLPAPPAPPPGPGPWVTAGPRGSPVRPVSDPDSEVESLLGYRYPPPLLPVGPSPTAPFWEVALLRRRERLLQDLLPGPGPWPGQCRCGCLPEVCGLGLGLPAGRPPSRYRADGLDLLDADADLPYRLGIGAYGLYGWSRPLHSHNTAPLGTARLHDNPN